MNKQYLTEQLLQLVKEGKNYEEIRSEAKRKGLTGPDLKTIMWKVDDLLLERESLKSQKGHALEWILVGIIVMILSVIATVYNVFEHSIIFYITVATFFGGMIILSTGLNHRKAIINKKEEEEL